MWLVVAPGSRQGRRQGWRPECWPVCCANTQAAARMHSKGLAVAQHLRCSNLAHVVCATTPAAACASLCSPASACAPSARLLDGLCTSHMCD